MVLYCRSIQFIGLNSFNNDFPFFWKITLWHMKIVGLFTKPLLFLHKGICCIVFCSAIFARFVQNPYTWAKIIMLLFPSNHSTARGFFSSCYFLYLHNLISVCFWLVNPLAWILYCVILSPWHCGQQSVICRDCTDYWDLNVVQQVERLCLAHISV